MTISDFVDIDRGIDCLLSVAAERETAEPQVNLDPYFGHRVYRRCMLLSEACRTDEQRRQVAQKLAAYLKTMSAAVTVMSWFGAVAVLEESPRNHLGATKSPGCSWKQLLGKIPDNEIAVLFCIKPHRVTRTRIEIGICKSGPERISVSAFNRILRGLDEPTAEFMRRIAQEHSRSCKICRKHCIAFGRATNALTCGKSKCLIRFQRIKTANDKLQATHLRLKGMVLNGR